MRDWDRFIAIALLASLPGPSSAKVIQIIPGFGATYPQGKIGGSSATGIPTAFVKIPAAKEYYLDYEVMFASDWDWVQGGKLPGLVGGSHTTGCNDIVPNGWSARFMWVNGGEGMLYLYHQNRQSGCGDGWRFPSPGNFVKGQWNRITEHVVINVPGQKNGIVEAWYNGSKKVTLTNIQLRGNVSETTALVNAVSLQTFYGGSSQDWAPPHTTHSTFSDFFVRDDLPDLGKPFGNTTSLRPAAAAPAADTRAFRISYLGNGKITLDPAAAGRIDIFTPQGRLLRSLASVEASRWDGRDAAGQLVPNGILLIHSHR